MKDATEQDPNAPKAPTIPARPFDPHWRAASAAMTGLVQDVLRFMDGYEDYYQTRNRKRSGTAQAVYEEMVEAIVCDLVHRELEVAGGQVYVSQSNQILRKKSRYKGVALGKTLPDVLKVMAAEEMSFVTLTKGQRKFTIKDQVLTFAVSGKQTALAAGSRLVNLIKRFGITFSDFGRSPDEEVIVLRGPKSRDDTPGELVEYDDTEETNTLRQQMQTINKWLEAADVVCTNPAVNLHDRHMKRIHNNSDFAQGGRLYGGFPRIVRRQRLWNMIEELNNGGPWFTVAIME